MSIPTTISDYLYIGRQPIVDRSQNLAGFELGLRASGQSALPANSTADAASLLQYAFGELGADTVLGRHKGAVSLPPALLMSDAVERLPKERVLLNIVGDLSIDAAMVERCHKLKAQGFALALDASVLRTPEGGRLLPLAHIIKVDVAQIGADRLQGVVRVLKPSGKRLLATGVERPELARQCLEGGFDYLQGQYFVRPVIVPGQKLDHGQMALMRLLGLILSDADIDEIVEAFKHYPDITLQMLRLANSAAVGARSTVSSISQAVTVMGRNHLCRWLQVLMFSTGGVPGVEFPSPILIQAATRGKLMELLARDLLKTDRAQQDRAFLVGMLSLLGAQFCIELEDLIRDLPLDADVRAALIERIGRLGVLLFLVETLEQPGFVDMQMAMDDIGVVEPDVLMALQVEAMNWANTLDTGSGRRATGI